MTKGVYEIRSYEECIYIPILYLVCETTPKLFARCVLPGRRPVQS